jgi:histidine ammonia-lyase
MGAHAARKLRSVIENTFTVLTIELLCAAQALEFQPLEPGAGVQAARARIRERVPPLQMDRYFKPDLDRLRELVRSGALLQGLEDAQMNTPADAAPTLPPESATQSQH